MEDPIQRMKQDYEAMQESLAKNIPSLSSFIQPKIPEMPIVHNPLIENVKANYASEFYNRLIKGISEFDAALDQSH
jgi:hypothetical protein